MKQYKKMAEATKIIGKDGKNDKTINNANEIVKSVGFRVISSLSNSDVVTFYNKDVGEYHISHRGTQHNSDHLTNAAVAANVSSPAIMQRTRQTESIVGQIPQGQTITMGGFSLGGFTALHAMVHSKKVRDKVSQIHTFNSGSHLLRPSHNVQNELNKKTFHYVIENDQVASWLTKFAVPFGTIKKYKGTSSKPHDLDNFPDIDINDTKERRKPVKTRVKINAKKLCRKYPQLKECKPFNTVPY